MLKMKRIPHSIQQAMPECKLYDNGIMEFRGKVFSVTFKLKDVDFSSGSEEEQENIFKGYERILNSFDTTATFRITIVNRSINSKQDDIYYLPENVNDGYDNLRIECNSMRRRNRARARGLIQEKYLTVTVHKKRLDLAEAFFDRFEKDYATKLNNDVSSGLTRVGTDEKLHLLHDFYRSGEGAHFNYSYKKAEEKHSDYRDYISPDTLKFNAFDFEMHGKYGSVFFVKDWGSSLKPKVISNMMELRKEMMISIDIIPMSPTEKKRFIDDAESYAEGNISLWSKKPGSSKKAGYAVIPINLRRDREKVNIIADEVNHRNQKLFMASVSGVFLTESREDIVSCFESLKETGSEGGCQVSYLGYRQLTGLNTVLPYGPRFYLNLRDVTTENLAAMMPFNYMMLNHRSGIPYGTHADNYQEIMIDRRLLQNGNEWITAKPGAGKSLRAKITIFYEVLMTNANVISIDPHGEFGPITRALGGQVILIGGAEGHIINIMEFTAGYGLESTNDIDSKIDTLSTIFKSVFGVEYTSYLNSIMTRSAYKLYMDYIKAGRTAYPPTVEDLYNEIRRQPESEATNLALLMEVFITGPLRCFNGQTNVNLYSRVICFDLSCMGESLWSTGMTAVMDIIQNKLIQNKAANIPTYIKVDEAARFLQDEELSRYFDRFYSGIRKLNGRITCIIQNISKVLRSGLAQDMLSNSEIVVMLAQSEADAAELQALYGMSRIQVEQLINAEEGCGLIKCGNRIFGYNGQIEQSGYIYDLVNTKPDYNNGQTYSPLANKSGF